MTQLMMAFGSLIAGALGFWIGVRGYLVSVLAGLAIAGGIAAGQYFLLHPGGFNGPAPAWPWGAVSLALYAVGLAAGVIASLSR